MFRWKFIPLFIVFILLYGCNKIVSETPDGRNEKLLFSSIAYHNHLKFSFVQGHGTNQRYSVQYLDTMYYFYLSNNFNPLFIKSFEEESFLISIINILGSAGDHGLDPEMYNASAIKDEFISAVIGDSVYPARYEHLANTEILIADALLKYAWHLRYGVVNPKELFPDSYFLPIHDSSSMDLFEPLKQTDLLQYLSDIQPKSKRYKDLQKALKYYEQFRDIVFTPLPAPAKKIEPGNKDSLVIHVTERLTALGFINTSVVKLNISDNYDSLLIEPVKEFQRLNGLIDDAIIGKATIEKLNTPYSEYISKIKLSLERFRWTDYSDTSKYILVNVPDFKLYAVENGEEKFEIKVCTGLRRGVNFEEQMEVFKKTKRYKPDDWETPSMMAGISHLVLNPTWTVPGSIIKEEIAREVKNDSTYLKRKNFQVFKNGTPVDPVGIVSSDLIQNSTQYRIVQDPGEQNALGKIKFMFSNPFGIYLHDTPSRAPFKKDNRAVSHGCIRVEKPIQLSEYLLKNQTLWNVDYLKLEIGLPVDDKSIKEEFYQKRSVLRKDFSYGRTTEVKLDKKIPIIVDYYTAWVDKDGKVNFRDDVYRKDKKLSEKLFPEIILKDALVIN